MISVPFSLLLLIFSFHLIFCHFNYSVSWCDHFWDDPVWIFCISWTRCLSPFPSYRSFQLLCLEICSLPLLLSLSSPSRTLIMWTLVCSMLSWREVAQSFPTLCDPVDCSPPGSSVHGILQARILEWVAISFSRGSSQPKDRTQVSCIAGRRFSLWATSSWLRNCPHFFFIFSVRFQWFPLLCLQVYSSVPLYCLFSCW